MLASGPCDDDPNRGGFSCCKTCNTTTPGPAIGYRFEYNVTYRHARSPKAMGACLSLLPWLLKMGVRHGA